ncbi:C40 family peptidase [Streptomyces sp. NPDC001251]
MATAGGFLMYVGISGNSIRDGLKALVGGKLPSIKTKPGGAIAKAEGAVSGPSGTAAGGGAVGAGPHPELVAAAQKYLGVPYLWGGTSAKGIDCSGLVVAAFQDAYHVTPPRTTYVQVVWSALKPIDNSQIGAGDLLFWPKVGPPGHVGIAVDSTHVIHAPRPGKKVEIVPINQAYTGGAAPTARRYVGTTS